MNARLRIEAVNLHWVTEEAPATDLCAHGGFRLVLGEELVIEDSSDWHALSAAAVCLLRTIWRDHVEDSPVCHQLVPCCGHEYLYGYRSMLEIGGCPYGLDFWVRHESDRVILTLPDRRDVAVEAEEWREAVTRFSRTVMSLFETSQPKRPNDYDSAGFYNFMKYWRRLNRTASGAAT